MADNSPEKLVFQLIADVKDFTKNLKASLDNGLKMIQTYQKQATQVLSRGVASDASTAKVSSEFDKLSLALAKAQKQFVTLKDSALGWDAASKKSGALASETAGLWDKMSDAAIRQKKSIQDVAQQFIASGQAEVRAVQDVLAHNRYRVLSEVEVNNAITKLQGSVNNAAKAQENYVKWSDKVVDVNKKIKDGADKTSSAFSGIGKNIASLVGSFGIIQGLQSAVEFLGNAAKASIDYAQAQFTLAVNVRAASNETNGASGTYENWLKRIQALRKELRIFSETDITKAISQTTVLTRVLKLNAEQQEQVIRIGATLAQMVGVELSQGVDDVTKALGGSSVVLDKYGLFLRDADKGVAAFELGFTEKIEKGTNSLNSQQLAMATLATIIKQVNPLMEELTGYQETLPGQIKETDAAISDATKALGADFDTIILGFKQVYLDFLQFLNNTLDNPLFNKVKELVDNAINLRQSQLGAGGGKTIEPDAVPGVSKGLGSNIFGAPVFQDPTTGIRFYARDQLAGDKENVDAYFDYVKAEIERVSNIIRSQDNSLTREPGDAKPGALIGGASGPDPEAVGMNEDFVAAQEKYSKAVVDAYDDMVKGERDALLERNRNIEDAGEKFLDEISDIQTELKRKQQDADRDRRQDDEDLHTKYLRSLAELEIDEAEKREDITKDSNDKTEEIWEDYYRRLRELDNQYYFDLRDAVAENDAVAVKRLERKYALDKQKLDDALQDKLNDEIDNREDSLEELSEETENRKAELNRRYHEEFEDLKTAYARKQEELLIEYDRDLEDARKAWARRRGEIEEEYEEDLDMLHVHYQDRLEEIVQSLAEEYDLDKTSVRKLLTLYDEYYGEGGKLWDLIDEFYEHQEDLAGELEDSIDDLDDILENSDPNKGVNVTTSTNGTQMNVVISGDGTIDDATIDNIADKIAKELSDTIESIVVTRGGSGAK